MALYRLFVAQYAARAETRRAGFFKRRMAYWVFTEEENERIPNFYTSVNDFIDRLEAADLILRLPAPVGEREVLPPPSAPGRDGDGGNRSEERSAGNEGVSTCRYRWSRRN